MLEELTEVVVGCGDDVARVIAAIGPRNNLSTNLHSGQESENRHAQIVFNTCSNGVMNVARVIGEQATQNDEDFASAMLRSMM